jgi:CO/xanthine dehydrogenase FAD-binding subunit
LTSVKEYFLPSAPNEVLELLQKYGDRALIVAGGSFVHGLDARDLLYGIEALIDIQNLELKEITSDADGLSLGAMVTFSELQRASGVADSAALGAVRDALRYPPVQIRNVATVGGNIASACPYFDLPTAMLALGGVVRSQGPGGAREIALQDFAEGLFQNSLEPGEFVTGLFLPSLPERSSSAFIKFETNANDLAIVNVGVCITLDASGTCQAARVAVGGGVAETPVRSPSCEALLQGKALTGEVFREAAAAVGSDLDPMSDHRASAAYRSSIAKTLAERSLKRALARLD